MKTHFGQRGPGLRVPGLLGLRPGSYSGPEATRSAQSGPSALRVTAAQGERQGRAERERQLHSLDIDLDWRVPDDTQISVAPNDVAHLFWATPKSNEDLAKLPRVDPVVWKRQVQLGPNDEIVSFRLFTPPEEAAEDQHMLIDKLAMEKKGRAVS
jgi:hypothetical protein